MFNDKWLVGDYSKISGRESRVVGPVKLSLSSFDFVIEGR